MGNRLFKEVTDLTGLPENLISKELVSILEQVGATPQAVTLEDLRKAMAAYLKEVIGPNLSESEIAESKRPEEEPSLTSTKPDADCDSNRS